MQLGEITVYSERVSGLFTCDDCIQMVVQSVLCISSIIVLTMGVLL